jgi:hypothetical protein
VDYCAHLVPAADRTVSNTQLKRDRRCTRQTFTAICLDYARSLCSTPRSITHHSMTALITCKILVHVHLRSHGYTYTSVVHSSHGFVDVPVREKRAKLLDGETVLSLHFNQSRYELSWCQSHYNPLLNNQYLLRQGCCRPPDSL